MVDQLKKEKDIKRINVSQAAGDLIEVIFFLFLYSSCIFAIEQQDNHSSVDVILI